MEQEMKSGLYYLLAVFLFILWFVGFMVFDIGGIFHVVFLLAVIVLITKIFFDYKKE